MCVCLKYLLFSLSLLFFIMCTYRNFAILVVLLALLFFSLSLFLPFLGGGNYGG